MRLTTVTNYPESAVTRCAELHPHRPTVFCTRRSDHPGKHHHEYSDRSWGPSPASDEPGRVIT
ncbi:hypothetical protein [Streptomyces sp. NPDC050504]|uniref:hypothetical protein n=1 Tax=Streptomyces sp. NPDC050504 TaxID=3365618 RepID=UPI0037AF6D3C